LKSIFYIFAAWLSLCLPVLSGCKPHVYGPGENGTFRIAIGEKVDIRLPQNGSTGFVNFWLNENECNAVRLADRQYESGVMQKLGYIGSGGEEKLTFVGVKAGTDTVKLGSYRVFEYRRDSANAPEKLRPDNVFIMSVTE